MQRQKQCFNHLLAPATWTQSVPGRTDPQKRKRRTSERISPPTPPLLIYLVENSHFLLSRLSPPTLRKTVPGVAENNNRVVTSTFLPQKLILFPKKKGGTCPKSSAITVIEKDITLTSVFEIRKRSQKTSDSLSNLHAGDYS